MILCLKCRRMRKKVHFVWRVRGYEHICKDCRDEATRADWAEARRLTHKVYESHR